MAKLKHASPPFNPGCGNIREISSELAAEDINR
jgi:hypothetical protein